VGKLKDHYLRQEDVLADLPQEWWWCPECKTNQPVDRRKSMFTSGDALECGHAHSGLPPRRKK